MYGVMQRWRDLSSASYIAKKCAEGNSFVPGGRAKQSLPSFAASWVSLLHCVLHELVELVQFSARLVWVPPQQRPWSQVGQKIVHFPVARVCTDEAPLGIDKMQFHMHLTSQTGFYNGRLSMPKHRTHLHWICSFNAFSFFIPLLRL